MEEAARKDAASEVATREYAVRKDAVRKDSEILTQYHFNNNWNLIPSIGDLKYIEKQFQQLSRNKIYPSNPNKLWKLDRVGRPC